MDEGPWRRKPPQAETAPAGVSSIPVPSGNLDLHPDRLFPHRLHSLSLFRSAMTAH